MAYPVLLHRNSQSYRGYGQVTSNRVQHLVCEHDRVPLGCQHIFQNLSSLVECQWGGLCAVRGSQPCQLGSLFSFQEECTLARCRDLQALPTPLTWGQTANQAQQCGFHINLLWTWSPWPWSYLTFRVLWWLRCEQCFQWGVHQWRKWLLWLLNAWACYHWSIHCCYSVLLFFLFVRFLSCFIHLISLFFYFYWFVPWHLSSLTLGNLVPCILCTLPVSFSM